MRNSGGWKRSERWRWRQVCVMHVNCNNAIYCRMIKAYVVNYIQFKRFFIRFWAFDFFGRSICKRSLASLKESSLAFSSCCLLWSRRSTLAQPRLFNFARNDKILPFYVCFSIIRSRVSVTREAESTRMLVNLLPLYSLSVNSVIGLPHRCSATYKTRPCIQQKIEQRYNKATIWQLAFSKIISQDKFSD